MTVTRTRLVLLAVAVTGAVLSTLFLDSGFVTAAWWLWVAFNVGLAVQESRR